MEARDSRSKIRPLPVDEIEGGLPQRRQEPVKKVLPLIGVALGALAFAVIALGLGPVTEFEVGSATTTAITVAATTEAPLVPQMIDPPLREMLPVAASLRFVEFTSTAARVASWAAGDTAPVFNATVNSPHDAAFNADGTLVLIHSLIQEGSAIINDAEGGRPIYLSGGVSSVYWHPTDPTAIAWTEGTHSDPTILNTANLTGIASHGVVSPLVEVELEPGLHLLAWGSWGFLLESSDTGDGTAPPEASLLVLDPAGKERGRLSGDFYGSSDDGLLLLARTDEDGVAMPFVVEADLSETPLTGLDIGAADFLLSSSGEWVIAVTPQADGHTSVLARTVRAKSTRLSSVRNETTVIGLVWEDRYVALQDIATGDLIFKDWSTGAEFHVPSPSDTRIGAIFL